MQRTSLVGLIRIELPDHDIRLCDGGFVEFDGLTYVSEDPVFGTILSLEVPSEGVGDEGIAGKLNFIPQGTVAAAALSKPGYQNSRMRFWIGEFDIDSGKLVGAPDLLMEGQTDRTVLKRGQGTRILEMEFVSRAERLFSINEGNSLTARFHKSVWPGEAGFDRAIGVPTQVAWGTASPPRGFATSAPAGGGGGYSVERSFYEAVYAR